VRRRLLLSYMTITVLVLVVLEVPLGIAFARSERRRLETDVQHDAFALAIRSEEALETTPPTASSDLRRLADRYADVTGGRAVIVDAAGGLVADSAPPAGLTGREQRSFASRPEIAKALRGQESTGSRHSDTLGTDLLYVAVPVASGGEVHGAVRVTYPLSVVSDRVRRNWLLLAGTGGVVLAVVFLVSLWLARSVTRPLADLERAAARLGGGDLAARARVPSGPAEVRLLAEEFNATASQLEELVGSQQAFVADASHQLRTPLAALRLRLENLEDVVVQPATEDLEGARAEVQRLTRLVDGLMTLARAEQAASAPADVDVGEVMAARRDAWAAFADERDVRIELQVEPGLRARGTPGRLEQVLDNLLNNSLDAAPPGTSVVLGGRRNRDHIEVRVADAGPGMTDEQRARAFDRFWRSRSTQSENGGFGLGLSIVRRLVTADGGDVELARSASGGLEVVVRLRAGTDGSSRSDELSQ
jgi:signal transduction histidine kinase